MSGPLKGVRIVDMTMNVLGPYASQILGDMGADILKIEPPEGDTLRGIGPARNPGMGPYFLHLNRNKRSIAIDLKRAEGRDVLYRMIDGADAFIYSFRAKAMSRLGLSYDVLCRRNPRLIYCGASGFGQSGPYADRPAYDDLIQAAIGMPHIQALGADEPVYMTCAIADRVAGIFLANAVGMALYYREKTGRGQAIEIPMFEILTQFIMGDHLFGSTFEPPLGPLGYVRMTHPKRRPYRTKDGYIGVMIYNDKHWRRFFEVIGRPELAEDPDFASMSSRTANIDAVYALLHEVFPTRTTAEWGQLLVEADIPATPLIKPEQLLEDRHMKSVGFFKLMDHPSEGPVRVMDVAQTWSETQPEIARHAPSLGEHTVEILRETGYDDLTIGWLIAEGSVVAPEIKPV
jgi:formyl-CoA transferase